MEEQSIVQFSAEVELCIYYFGIILDVYYCCQDQVQIILLRIV